jgi:PQQ-dependent dehydrogenase (methanol/ethanol family)
MGTAVRSTLRVTSLAAAGLLAAALRGASPSPAPGEWVRAAGDYASRRFSDLSDVRAENVHSLQLAWSFDTGVTKGHEAAPLVVGGTLYVVTPYPNVLWALDAATGAVKWSHHPKPLPAAQGVACCDVVNRGAAYDDGRVFFTTLDGRTIGVDAATGAELWSTRLADVNRGETITMAPLAVRGKVLVGDSGGEMGVRGWLAALDQKTGREVWRAYSTGPDRDVLIGDGFRPFYASDRGTDLGVATWPGDSWKIGGGTVWGWLSYDPELNLVYYGTSNPGPWNEEQRPGDNKWTATIFARDPDTGAARWAYQVSPHDLYDYDAVNECVLVDLTIRGAKRRVLVHPDRNGYVYVLDRATGEVLSARPFVPITTSTGVDLASGRLAMAASKRPHVGLTVRDVCPAAPGGKDWPPSAYSPLTGLLYIPHNNLCQDQEGVEANYVAGTPYVGANIRMRPGPGGHMGAFTAWDPAGGRAKWSHPERFPVWCGALATAGQLVFYGTLDGLFKALDARSGAPLWEYRTHSGIVGQPVTYRGPDGRQYVAVLAGIGGWVASTVAGDVDPRDRTAALGLAAATRDLRKVEKPGPKNGRLYVFALP